MTLELNFDQSGAGFKPETAWYDVHFLDADWCEVPRLRERAVSWKRVCDLIDVYKLHTEGRHTILSISEHNREKVLHMIVEVTSHG